MHKKKNKKRLMVMILVAVLILIGGYFGINYYFNKKIKDLIILNSIPMENSRNQILINQKNALISNLNKYKQFGQWPIGKIDLTPDRGNPFEEKIDKE